MIVNKYSNGGIGGGVTPEQVQEQINSALTPYWDSATTKSAIAEVATGISLVLEGYATSDDMQSAFTLISETQQAAEAGYNQLEARIDELSGSSPDLSAYYTSAQTESAIEEALSGYSPDLSAYYTSAQTENAIEEAIAGYSPDLSAYYTSAQTESAIEEAIAGVSVDLSGYYTSAQTQDAIDEAMTAYTPTTGFSTINGSAITAGGNIVIESTSVDLSGYYTSAQTESAIEEAIAGVSVDLSAYWTSAETQSAITAVEDHLYDVEEVTASALTELHDNIQELSGSTSSALTELHDNIQELSGTTSSIQDKFSAYTPTTGFSTINGSAITNGGDIVIQGGGGGSTEEIELPIAAAVNASKDSHASKVFNKSAVIYYIIHLA